MSRPIAYNASGPLSGSIRGGNVNYTVDSGNRDYNTFASKKWVPSADGVAPIVFVTDTYTQGFELNPNLAVPLFYSCNGTGSAAILYTANRIPNSPGNYSDANVALNDLINARGYFILESNDPFEGVDADSLALDLDASKMSSYPQTGTNWRDLSGQGNTGALTNGPTWNSNGWFQFDGVDDHVNFNPIILSGDFSITQTVNLSPRTNGNMPIGGGSANGGSNFLGYVWFLNTANIIFFRVNGEAGPAFSVDSSKWLNKNITYTVTRNGTTGKLYINGTEEGLQFIPTNNFDIRTIGYSYNFVYTCEGNISSTKIYNKALSQAEVKQNYFGAPIVTDGLVFAVDANNIVSYPKSGTTWYNLTGSAGNATLYNGPAFNQQNGGAIVYDGVDDYVGVLSFNVPYLTVSTWVYKTSTSTNQGISRKENGWAVSQYNGTLQVAPGTSWNFYNTGYTIPLNTWVNIVYTYSGTGTAGSQTVYINGVPIWDSSIGSGPIASNNNAVWIGYDDNGWHWGGKIANNRIYNRALSAAEVQQNYQAEQYRFETYPSIPTNGLILHLDAGNPQSYPGSGTVWYDISGQGANADLVNGVTWNPSGYFFFDGADDIANSINISQDYRDLVIGIWSESNGGLEMVFSLFGGSDASFRLNNNNLTNPGNDDDWQFGSNNLVFVDGVYTPDSNLGSQFHFVRTYRSNNVDFGTSFRYSLSSTFLSRYFKGKIAFVLCYNRQLSDAEVRGLYYYYKDRFPF